MQKSGCCFLRFQQTIRLSNIPFPSIQFKSIFSNKFIDIISNRWRSPSHRNGSQSELRHVLQSALVVIPDMVMRTHPPVHVYLQTVAAGFIQSFGHVRIISMAISSARCGTFSKPDIPRTVLISRSSKSIADNYLDKYYLEIIRTLIQSANTVTAFLNVIIAKSSVEYR